MTVSSDLLRSEMDRINAGVKALDLQMDVTYKFDHAIALDAYVGWKNFVARWAVFFAEERPETLPLSSNELATQARTFELELLSWRGTYTRRNTGQFSLPPFTPSSEAEPPPPSASAVQIKEPAGGRDLMIGLGLVFGAVLLLSATRNSSSIAKGAKTPS